MAPPFSETGYTPPSAMPEYLIRYATLRQLQIFEASVRLGSFSKAAEELFVTQPTVSMQIKKLSDALGIALFEQVGRNVRPTEVGRELYEACRKIFESLANLEMKVSDHKGMKRGRLRLGVVTTAKYFVPEVLGEFCRLYPGIDVALKVSNRDRITERLNAYEDDLYIVGQAPTDAMEIESFPFAPNPLVVLASRDHPLVDQKNIPLSRIAEEPLILREPGSGIRDATLRRFQQHDLQPNVRMELGSNEAIKHAVVGGLGIAILSLHTLSLEGPDGPVTLLDVEGFPIMRQWHLVYPKGKELSLVANAFLEFSLDIEPRMREKMKELWPEMADALSAAKPAAKFEDTPDN
ncbi:MAG: LysR substrate-binding domain-containing protein [Gammaproteobacteria bacterium]|jgi:LysR family transcriptional regulator, low CO2-responsive transcriptional regulator